MRNRRIRKLWKRTIAVFLTCGMLAGVVPMDVLAVVLSDEDVRTLEEELSETWVDDSEVVDTTEEEMADETAADEETLMNEKPNVEEDEVEIVANEMAEYQSELAARMASDAYVEEMDSVSAAIEANAAGANREDFKELYGVSYEEIFECCPSYLTYPHLEATVFEKMEGYVIEALNVCDEHAAQAEFYYKLSQGINYPLNEFRVSAGIKDSDYVIYRKQVAQKVVEDYLATANPDMEIMQNMEANLSRLTKIYDLSTEYSKYVADIGGGLEKLSAMGSGTVDQMIIAVAGSKKVAEYASTGTEQFALVTEIMALQEIEVQTIDFLIETLSISPNNELAKGLQDLRKDIEMDPVAYVLKYYCTDKIIGKIVKELGKLALGNVYVLADKLYDITVGVANYIYELGNPSYEEINKAYIAWTFYLNMKSTVNKYKKSFNSGYSLRKVVKYEAAYSLYLSSLNILMNVSAKCLKQPKYERTKNKLIIWSDEIGKTITYDNYIAGCARLIKADIDSGVLTITEKSSSNINTPKGYDSTQSVSAKLTAVMKQYVPNVGQTWNGNWGGAVQCFGFARMVFSLLYGCEMPSAYYGSARYQYATDNNVVLAGQLVGADVTTANVSSMMAQAKVGDIIQASGAAYGQHTMVVAGVSDSGVTVYDCNAHLDSDVNNVIHTHTLSWNTWVSWYGSSNSTYGTNGISLYRAENYASIYGNGDDLFYDDSVNFVIENGVLKKYNGWQPFVVIPDGVTEIGSGAFQNNTTMVSVEIPDGVVKIGSSAFSGCSGLVGVYVPDSVEEIGTKAFSRCSSLSSVRLSQGLIKLDWDAFYDCDGLTSIEIPKSLDKVGIYLDYYTDNGPFNECSNLKTVTFEDGITEISNNLFAMCDGVESVIIPDTVTKIENYAFYGCKNLKEIKIPDTVIKIGSGAFGDCVELREIYIPDSVEEISTKAFSRCSSLSNVRLSKRLTKLDWDAFYDCDELTSIEIPKSLDKVGIYLDYYTDNGPFNECSNLKTVTFEDGITEISNNLFAMCDGVESVIIPDTVTKIENYAFYGCKNLKEIKMPDTVTKIGSGAFGDCVELREIYIPDSVEEISTKAFSRCSSLSNVRLSKRLTKLDWDAFYDCDELASIEIPKSLDKVGIYLDYYTANGPFNECSNLKTVTFEDGITEISNNLFAMCDGVENIIIPDTVLSIENHAFYNCANLKTIKLSTNTKKMGSYVFSQCNSLIEIVIPDSVAEIGNDTFRDCTKLQKVHLPEIRQNIMKNMFYNCTSLSEINLPSTLIAVRENAFYNCDSLTEIILPENVATIEQAAFYDCDNLQKAVIPDAVTQMGNYVFSDCESLSDLTVGNGCETIPQYAFSDCGQLQAVVLPYGVKTISAYAFKNDPKLTSITIPRSTTGIANGVFSYPAKLTIYGVSGTYPETYANENSIKFVNQSVSASAVVLNKNATTLDKGSSEQLVASVTPINHTEEIIWVSSDESIVKVSERGKITAVAKGQADITVIAGNVSATCTVTVTQPVTSIYLDKSKLTLKGGETYVLIASVYPKDATNKTLQWSSSDESVATVSATGKVKGLKMGKATITVQAGSRTATCDVVVTSNAGEPSEKTFPFSDIAKTPGNWKYDNVKYVYDNGIMNGIAGTDCFDPDGKLNRAMFATVLYRMAGEPDVSFKKKFSDVEDGKYYSKAIIWANNQGIVNGFSDGSYGVTTNITREQIAKMLYEYASKQGLDVSGAASIDTFTDKETVSGWAVGYMKWAVDAGMISGKPNGDGTFRLDPKGEATRAECAKMLTMFMKKYE